jgi:hypothetical protein
MFGFFKNRSNDEPHAREFVRYIFVLGRETCTSVGKAIQMIPPDNIMVPITEDTSLEVSLAILGTSLAVLKGHSKIMSLDRGAGIETWCKQSIERDYDLPLDSTSKLIKAVNEYQATFERAMQCNINPFGEISGIMLARLLGSQVKSFCVKGTTALDPVLHQIVGDIMTMAITQAVDYWKER